MLNRDAAVIVYDMVKRIREKKDYLSEMDGAIGDGDHGINMNKGFTKCLEKLEGKNPDAAEALKMLGTVLLDDIGGSMGPLYGTFFMGMSDACQDAERVDKFVFGKMLANALAEVQTFSEAKVGDKTLMDTLIPAVEAYKKSLEQGVCFSEALQNMKEAAEAGKESTRNLVAKLGRASRLGERSRGVLDAGAASCCLILQSMADTILKNIDE